MATTSTLLPTAGTAHSEFSTVPLHLDLATATDLVHDALNGVTTTEADEGVKVRTTDGMLIAILTGDDPDEPTVELHYRIAPPSGVATLKARKLSRAFAPYAG